MFRGYNFNDVQQDDKIVLYKNVRQKLGYIKPEWIDKINYKHKDISTFTLTIPKYIGLDKHINPIYEGIYSGQFIVINDAEKFVLKEKKGTATKSKSTKSFTCYSYEKTFQDKRVTIEEGNYQLISNDIVVTKGILEEVLAETRYTVGTVDRDAMYQTKLDEDTKTLKVLTNYKKDNVQYDQLLWEKDFNIDIGDNPLYLNVNYLNIKTTNGSTIIKQGERVYTTFTDAFYTGIKHIKCYYISEVSNRWACKYIVTLADNTTQEFIYPFTNITNYTVQFDMEISYGLGTYSNHETIRLPYFDTIDDTLYATLQDIEEAFDCTLDYDHVNKKVNVIANKNVGKTKGVYLSFDNNILEVTTNETNSIPSALKVIGKDNLSIASENIFGGNTIYNYDYYEKFMSAECKKAWDRYIALLTVKKEEFKMLKDNRQILNNRLIRLDSEIKAMEDRIKYTKSILSTYISTGEDKDQQKKIKTELTTLQNYFNKLQRDRVTLKDKIQKYDDDIQVVANAINKETASDKDGKIFTSLDLDEIDSYTVVEKVEDDYYTVPSALYLEAERLLKDKVVEYCEWTMKASDITKISKDWRKQITLGDLFKTHGEVKSTLGQDLVRLVGFTYIPSKKQITSLEFTNKDKKEDVLKKSANSARKSSGNNNVINSWNTIMQDAVISNNFVATLMKQGLDASAYSVRSREGNNIFEISNAGEYIINKDDENKQLYMGNSVFAFTTDGWKTSKTALTPNGITAESIVGKLLCGQELVICTTTPDGEESNSFYIGNLKDRVPDKTGKDFGLHIADTTKKQRIFIGLEDDGNDGYKAIFRLVGKNGDVCIDENGILSPNYYELWNNCSPSYPLETYVYVPNEVKSIKEVILKIRLGRYRGFTKDITTSTTKATCQNNQQQTSSSSGASKVLMFNDRWSTNHHDTTDVIYKIPNTNFAVTLPFQKINPDLDSYLPEELWSSGSTDNHTHTVPPHNHVLNLEFGTNVQTGIKLYEKASGVFVNVNGKTVLNNINTDSEIDIAKYLTIGQDNKIQIGSTTNGYIGLGVLTKWFIAW